MALDDRTSNRSLGNRTAQAMAGHLAELDRMYETGEARRLAALPDLAVPQIANGSLRELARWAGDAVRTASA